MPEASLSWLPDLTHAIDRDPLVVPPTLSLTEAIALISQFHSPRCDLAKDIDRSIEPLLDLANPLEQEAETNSEPPVLPPSVLPASAPAQQTKQTSCMLVTQNRKLLGILTERDIVRLTAQTIDISAKTVAEVMIHPVITLPQSSIHDIFAALFLFRRYRIRHLPIVDAQHELVGVISHENIRQILRPANLLRFRRVADVMVTPVIQVPLTTPLLSLTQLMAEQRVSCVVITQVDEAGTSQPVGIITERDIVQYQAFHLDFQNTPAHLVMSTPLFLLHPDDSLWTAHQEMQQRRVGRLVVSWNWGQGLGIVTQTSLLRVFDPIEMYRMIENLQQTIEQQTTEQHTAPLPSPIDPAPLKIAPSPSPSIDPSSSPAQLTSAQLTSAQLTSAQLTSAQLSSIHKTIRYLLSQPNLPSDQQRSLLHSILETLEQTQSNRSSQEATSS